MPTLVIGNIVRASLLPYRLKPAFRLLPDLLNLSLSLFLRLEYLLVLLLDGLGHGGGFLNAGLRPRPDQRRLAICRHAITARFATAAAVFGGTATAATRAAVFVELAGGDLVPQVRLNASIDGGFESFGTGVGLCEATAIGAYIITEGLTELSHIIVNVTIEIISPHYCFVAVLECDGVAT